jgi:hypothetical protein
MLPDGQSKIEAVPVTLKPWRSDALKRHRLKSINRYYGQVLEVTIEPFWPENDETPTCFRTTTYFYQ